MSDKFSMIAKTPAGLEPILADELRALGIEDAEAGRRLVSFSGDQRLLYLVNIWCRTAIRVLKPISAFTAGNERELYEGVQETDWTAHLDVDGSLAIDPVVHNSFFTHSLYAAQLAKDAIVDQFRDRTGQRPSVDRDQPDLRINLHINQNRVTIYLDSSGDSLHKRGYRKLTNEAPINEVLAAGIIRLTGWDGNSPLCDFMCGSGTFVIEAALMARNIAPGTLRKSFGYMRWKDFDQRLHDELLTEAARAQRPELTFPLSGSDLDPQVIEAARINARQAGVGRDTRFEVAGFESARPPAPGGILITNPPYDERMKVSQLEAVYRRIGDALKQNWAGRRAFVFTGNLDAPKQIGLKPSRRVPLFNGPIECRLLEFFVRGRASVVSSPRPDESGDAPAGGPSGSAPPSKGQTWLDQVEILQNRLARMAKHWQRWARRQGITCFRLYDRDIPEIPLAIDWYEGHLHIAEYDRPHARTDIEHKMWLQRMVETAATTLGVSLKQTSFKPRQRQRGQSPCERQGEQAKLIEVSEGGHRFQVKLSDDLDTGLFLDHRVIRSLIEQDAAGKHFLSLFGYTGAFTVVAAAGGATSTTAVDASQSYSEWARANMTLNGFRQACHQYVVDDARDFLRNLPTHGGQPFDLAVVAPPTIVKSRTNVDLWDVQRDHAELLNLLLEHMTVGGKVFFLTSSRKFKLHDTEIRGATIREISRQTVPADFRNKRIHRCWTLIRTVV